MTLRPVILTCLVATLLAPLAGAKTLTLEIRHLWRGQPLTIPGNTLQTRGGESIELTRLSYLLSEPQLLASGDNISSGDWIRRTDWFAFVDAAAGPTILTLGGLPDATITNLRFHIGPDAETDRGDPSQYPARHPLNPVLNNLHWTPQGGYIFLALEGHRRDGDESTGFAYHLGNSWNRMAVTLPASLDLTRNATVTLDFHLDRLFDTTPFLKISDQDSTHSRRDDPLATTLKQRSEGAFSVAGIRYTSPPVLPQPAAKPVNTVGTPYRFRVAKGFPIPELPTDYPLTNERVRLGRELFHDPILSRNGTLSCASCHQSASALTDPRRFSLGVDGYAGSRNAMPLFNMAWKRSFFWDGRAPSLRAQALIPIEDHLEMDETLENVVGKLGALDQYPRLFEQAFGTADITPARLGIAIEQFVLTLTSYDSRFDQAARSDTSLTEQEKRGFELFMTEYDPRRGLRGADCFHCHGGAHFTDHRFHNNGLKPTDDTGLEGTTGKETDRAKFSTPSLRNIALTAPYMHDGRFASLEEVIDHYNAGLHRSLTLDPNLAKHPRDGLGLTDADKQALIAFLKSLRDPTFK